MSSTISTSLPASTATSAGGGNINQQIERVQERIKDTLEQIRNLVHDDSLGPKEKEQVQALLQAQLEMLHQQLQQLLEARLKRSDKHAPAQASADPASNPVTKAVGALNPVVSSGPGATIQVKA
ncbi:hypothetical protein JHS3_18620 [Jeongeupia sp. HS-3]|uniref:FlxA-like family protein n=1 Tax=Jeongeupia sp. HS-3 TaxID=1009682 RepID=UPI0018A53715|nr:FlxA-like family protein [Jeongeupia sp. HS-3]BCL76126.1 hypothetical protein JHS3_18620 [Jeongeupia sp. HS-3]